jgi:transposase
LHPAHPRLLKLTLEELRVIEDHLGQLDQQMADLLAAHHDAVQHLAEIPGLGVDSAQQIIAEVGATAEERGPAVSAEAKTVRARKMIRDLRGLGYRVDLIAPTTPA